MVTKEFIKLMAAALVTDGATFGSTRYLSLCTAPPSVNPPVNYADCNPVPTADLPEQACASMTAFNWNGGTEWATMAGLKTFTPAVGVAPLTVTSWCLTAGAHTGKVFAYGDFETPITFLGDDSTVTLVARLRMNQGMIDVEFIDVDA